MILATAVGRPPGCVPRGLWQGATRRNSGSIAARCSAAPRAGGGRSGLTRKVAPQEGRIGRLFRRLQVALSGQLPCVQDDLLVARAGAARRITDRSMVRVADRLGRSYATVRAQLHSLSAQTDAPTGTLWCPGAAGCQREPPAPPRPILWPYTPEARESLARIGADAGGHRVLTSHRRTNR